MSLKTYAENVSKGVVRTGFYSQVPTHFDIGCHQVHYPGSPTCVVRRVVCKLFMPPKELWEAYSNRTVRPSVRQSVRPSVRQSVRPAFVSGPYLLYSLR